MLFTRKKVTIFKVSLQAEYFQTGKKMLARPFSCENGDISVAGIWFSNFTAMGLMQFIYGFRASNFSYS